MKRQEVSNFPQAALANALVLLATLLIAAAEPPIVLGTAALLGTALLAGLLAGTWWATISVPAAMATAIAVAAATNGPSAGGGEPLPVAAISALAMMAATACAGGAATGVLLGKALSKTVAPWFQASEGKLLGGTVLIVAVTVAFAVTRDNRTAGRLGIALRTSDGVTTWSGRPWDGQGRWGISEQEARSSTEFGVYWLGSVFGGLHLQEIYRTPPNGAGEFIFSYGTCSADGSSCPVPLSIHSDPICRIGPTPQDGRGGSPEVIAGGAWLRRLSDGSYWIWTGDSVLSVHGSAIAEADVLTALTTLNGVVPGGLRPPDFQACPGRPSENPASPARPG